MRKISLIIFTLLVCSPLYAGNKNISYDELDIIIDPLSVSIGDITTCIKPLGYTSFFNPSTLLLNDSKTLGLMHSKYFMDSSISGMSFITHLNIGTLGINAAYFKYGDMAYIDENGILTGQTANPYSISTAISYSRYLLGYFGDVRNKETDFKLASGAYIRSVYRNYDSFTDFVVVLGAGIHMEFNDSIIVGVSVNNLNISTGSVPGYMKAGVSASIFKNILHKIQLLCDFKINFFDLPSFSFGAEYSFIETIYVRVGYILKQSFTMPEDSLYGLRGGFSYIYDDMIIEYAVSANGIWGCNHFFSISYKI